jgi:hypothetical protein
MEPDQDIAAELTRLRGEQDDLAAHEQRLLSQDHGGGLPADDQNRLERVRERWADVTQQIENLQEQSGVVEE